VKELLIVSTNEAERQLAISKFNEALHLSLDKSGRSKSKSPRRTRYRELDVPPSPALNKGYKSGSASTGSVVGSANGVGSSSGIGSSKAAPPRRPHTSAGPRDKAYDFAGARLESAYNRERDARAMTQDGDVHRQRRADGRGEVGSSSRPSTSQGETKRRSGAGKAYNFFGAAPRLGTALSGSSTTSTSASGSGSITASTSRSTSSSMSSHGADEEDRMREWEEELAKIEMRSRRSSDMAGFAGKRKRSAGASRVEESSSSQSEA
jgi:hypothetical protein